MIIELRQKSQITIPSEYVKLLSLSAGDKLEIMVKDGALMLVPVTVYPKDYVKKLESELSKLKKQIESGEKKSYDNLDDMFASLDEE